MEAVLHRTRAPEVYKKEKEYSPSFLASIEKRSERGASERDIEIGRERARAWSREIARVCERGRLEEHYKPRCYRQVAR